MEVIAADHEIEIKKNTQEKMMEKLEEGVKYVVELSPNIYQLGKRVCSREAQSGVDSVVSTQQKANLTVTSETRKRKRADTYLSSEYGLLGVIYMLIKALQVSYNLQNDDAFIKILKDTVAKIIKTINSNKGNLPDQV